jgi:phosphate transport system substrate-binding protein
LTHNARLAAALILVLWIATSLADTPLAGKLLTTGSDTMGSLTSLWAETLMREHPQVSVQVRAIGSGAAPTALIEGTADIGPMSRSMSAEETRAFTARHGYAPTAIPVALDELAVFVHRDNPLVAISIPQLDAVFSVTRRCGFPRALRSWGDLGLGGSRGSRRISIYGRSTASGTYSFFRREVLCGGDFLSRANRLVGSSAVVRAVSKDLGGIGYSSAGYLHSGVKRLQVLREDGEALSGSILSRRLLLYINLAPGEKPQGLVSAFLRAALDPTGQREVTRAGYLPLPTAELVQLWVTLGLDTP